MNIEYYFLLNSFFSNILFIMIIFSSQDQNSTENSGKFILSEEITCFKKKFIRKFFNIIEEYSSPQDFFIDIENGNYDEILQPIENYHDFIQLCVEILTERVNSDGELQKNTFSVCTAKIERNDMINRSIVNHLNKNILNQEQQGSSWNIVGI